LLQTPVQKDIFLFDITPDGFEGEFKGFVGSYSKHGVFVGRIKNKRFGNSKDDFDTKINIAITESILRFNTIKSNTYDAYVFLSPNMVFQTGDFHLLVENGKLFNAISPVIESYNGIEVLSAIFDRYGVEYLSSDNFSTHFITGAIEDTYALNPKCFALSTRYARRMKNFYKSSEDPVQYLNSLVYENSTILPKVDTRIFVHEHLY
jgi:hypothetical protein